MGRTKASLGTGKRCYCSTCDEYFSTVSNFDKHRKGEYPNGRYCADPEAVGLVVRRQGSNTFWSMPGQAAVN